MLHITRGGDWDRSDGRIVLFFWPAPHLSLGILQIIMTAAPLTMLVLVDLRTQPYPTVSTPLEALNVRAHGLAGRLQCPLYEATDSTA